MKQYRATSAEIIQLDLIRQEHERITASRYLADIVDGWCRDGRVSRAQASQFREVMCGIVKKTNQEAI